MPISRWNMHRNLNCWRHCDPGFPPGYRRRRLETSRPMGVPRSSLPDALEGVLRPKARERHALASHFLDGAMYLSIDQERWIFAEKFSGNSAALG